MEKKFVHLKDIPSLAGKIRELADELAYDFLDVAANELEQMSVDISELVLDYHKHSRKLTAFRNRLISEIASSIKANDSEMRRAIAESRVAEFEDHLYKLFG